MSKLPGYKSRGWDLRILKSRKLQTKFNNIFHRKTGQVDPKPVRMSWIVRNLIL